LNVAENNINVSNSNVKVAALELEGVYIYVWINEKAQVEHKSYNSKICGSICTLIVIGVIVFIAMKMWLWKFIKINLY
jgi:hypothetical protein